MLYSARQTWERIVYRVLGHGRMAYALGFYIGPFAALAGILLFICIILHVKKKNTPAIVTGILSVLCALIWRFAWIDHYYSHSSATLVPVIVVAFVVGFIVFKREKQSNQEDTEQTQLELERLRLQKERLELERMRQQIADSKHADSKIPAEEKPVQQMTAEKSATEAAEYTPAVEAIVTKIEAAKGNQTKEEKAVGLFGKKEDKRDIAPVNNAFDPGSGMSFKAPTMKEWTLYRDSIQLGNESFAFSDLSRIVNAEIPKNRLLQGVINIFPKSGGFRMLGYSFGQKDAAAKAVAYVEERIVSAMTPEELAAQHEQEAFKAGKERRMRCNVCGSLFCYTYQDLMKNLQLQQQAAREEISSGLSGLAGGLNVLGGNSLLGSAQTASSNSAQTTAEIMKSRIRDYNRCPNCNSTDLKQLTDDEYREALAAKNAPAAPAAAPSAADELKKFKELLDMGIISQEEFDAKKKQLLGL